mmetsp:Transcript_42954/g.85066  ORF Transcript_42954/g.85066 Transcript_42954/m.85066 type:complete len:207 (+) Transcript_42954:377-997(+)
MGIEANTFSCSTRIAVANSRGSAGERSIAVTKRAAQAASNRGTSTPASAKGANNPSRAVRSSCHEVSTGGIEVSKAGEAANSVSRDSAFESSEAASTRICNSARLGALRPAAATASRTTVAFVCASAGPPPSFCGHSLSMVVRPCIETLCSFSRWLLSNSSNICRSLMRTSTLKSNGKSRAAASRTYRCRPASACKLRSNFSSAPS